MIPRWWEYSHSGSWQIPHLLFAARLRGEKQRLDWCARLCSARREEPKELRERSPSIRSWFGDAKTSLRTSRCSFSTSVFHFLQSQQLLAGVPSCRPPPPEPTRAQGRPSSHSPPSSGAGLGKVSPSSPCQKGGRSEKSQVWEPGCHLAVDMNRMRTSPPGTHCYTRPRARHFPAPASSLGISVQPGQRIRFIGGMGVGGTRH